VLDLFERMHAADALPLGPRTCGYRLKELYVGEYTKRDFPAIGEVVKRLQQDGRLSWSWVADASAVTYVADGWDSPDEFIRQAHTLFRRDRRTGQPLVLEVYAEARETLGLIRRLGAERGVTVYSGGGSCGPNLAHKVAARAVVRAVEVEQSTLILGICDFDQAGIRNVLRPHLEHLSAFLYGTAGNDRTIAYQDTTMLDLLDGGPSASFRHLALTPGQARELVETETDQHRIDRYVTSGADLWTRNLDLLDQVQKVETEALDPVALRDMVVEVIDRSIDADALELLVTEEDDQRADLRDRFTELETGS
jgi:hypothetical protein